MKFPYKLGLLGFGNMAQALLRGWMEKKVLEASAVYISNRSPGKTLRIQEEWPVHVCLTNEEVLDSADIVFVAVKPQDLDSALDPILPSIRSRQIIVSLAAGVSMRSLKKKSTEARWVKVAANTPSIIQKGVFGIYQESADQGVETLLNDLLAPLGKVYMCETEDEFEAVMVGCSAGTGFVYELMMYFQDWMEERGIDSPSARDAVVQTFLGASLLASHARQQSLEDLQNKVASKKGITEAGLHSMRELEIERLLRLSFEKASLRNQELARPAK